MKRQLCGPLEVFSVLEGSTVQVPPSSTGYHSTDFMKLVKVSRIQWSGHFGSKKRRGKHRDAKTGLFKYTTLAHRISKHSTIRSLKQEKGLVRKNCQKLCVAKATSHSQPLSQLAESRINTI